MIYFATALFFFTAASFQDIKTHEVSPKITYSLAVIGLFLHAAESLFSASITPIFMSASMMVICFLFSYSLYKLGVWAGGDVKLFTALGAILPSHGVINFLPFYALAASLIAVFPVIFIYVLYHLLKVEGLFKKAKSLFVLGILRSIAAPFVITAAYFTAQSFGVPLASLLIAPFLYFMKKPGLVFSFALTLFAFYTSLEYAGFFSAAFALSVLVFLLIASYSAARKHVLRETKKASQLREGDILARNLAKKGKKLVFEEPNFMSFNDRRIILSALNAGGLEKKDIAFIRKNKIKEVELKKSLPFVPIFTVGLLLVFLLEMLL